jgi:hypothetical protein
VQVAASTPDAKPAAKKGKKANTEVEAAAS